MLSTTSNLSQSLIVQFPNIWQPNVSIGQLVIALVFNFISYYFHEILFLILPNILLLILYLILNNVSLSIVSNDENGLSLAPKSLLFLKSILINNDNTKQFSKYICPSDFSKELKFYKQEKSSSFSLNNFQNPFINAEVPPVSNVKTSTSTTCTTFTTPTTTSLCLPVTSVISPSYPRSSTTVPYPPSSSISSYPSCEPKCVTSTYNNQSVVNNFPVCSVTMTMSSPPACDLKLQSPTGMLSSMPEEQPLPDLSYLSVKNASTSNDNLNQVGNFIDTIKPDFSKSNPRSSELESEIGKTVSPKLNLGKNSEIKTTSKLTPQEINVMLKILPKFTGDLKDYKSFKNQFKIIVDHEGLTQNDKGLLLYCSLDKGIIGILGNITLNNNIDYDILWDVLDYEFSMPLNGPYSFSNNLSSLDHWPICNSLEKLTKLYEFVLQNYRALEREEAHKHDLIIAMKVLSILEGDIAYSVASVIDKHLNNPILPDILRLIKEEIRCLQLCQLADECKFESNSLQVNNFHSWDFQENTLSIDSKNISSVVDYVPKSCLKNKDLCSLQKCLFCHSENHDSHNCQIYNRPLEFHKFIFSNFSCFNCLRVGHKSYACPKAKYCTLCNDERKHSPVLCCKKYQP